MHRPRQSQPPDSFRRTSLGAAGRWPRLSRVDWLLVVVGALTAIITGTFLVTDGFRRASELTQAQQSEAHSLDVIATAERTRSAIANMRLGDRGYLLTSDEAYLKPYYAGRQQSRASLQQLHELTRDNREQVESLGRLTALLQRVDESLTAEITDQRSGRAAEALAALQSRDGEQTITAVDAEIDRMTAAENRLLQQRRKALRDADAAAWQNRLALSVLGLAALTAMVWLLFRSLSARNAVDFQRERADLAEQLIQRDTQLAEQIEELNALYASAPIGLAFFNRDYEYLRINEELARINGWPVEEHIGRSVREVLPAHAEPLEGVIDEVFASGEPLNNLEFTAASPLAPDLPRHWLTGFYPVRNERGDVEAVGAWILEISDRKKAEEREVLLAREVDHRAKNLLAVVQSVVQLTKADSADELKVAITGRIQALARAHSLLAEARWDGAQLTELVRDELAPYLDEPGERIDLSGPSLLLRPAAAQSLAMVLHELATNAAKYGALSTAAGQLSVRWRRSGEQIELHWTEHGGPVVEQPQASGFGSKIIEASIKRQLHGSLEQNWRPEGLQCTIRISTREALGSSEKSSA